MRRGQNPRRPTEYLDEHSSAQIEEMTYHANILGVVIERVLARDVKRLGRAKGKLLEAISIVQEGILEAQKGREAAK